MNSLSTYECDYQSNFFARDTNLVEINSIIPVVMEYSVIIGQGQSWKIIGDFSWITWHHCFVLVVVFVHLRWKIKISKHFSVLNMLFYKKA